VKSIALLTAIAGRNAVAMPRKFIAAIYWRFEDNTVLAHEFASGSREACEAAAKNPPSVPPPSSKKVVRTWVAVYPAANSIGQE
jgi:hypothetical protein